MTKLKIEDLNIYYNKSRIVRDINLEIEENKITSIIGPSGCGKTTFISCLNRMIEDNQGHYTGKILLDHRDIREMKLEEVRKTIGMVFQKPTPFPLSIYKNLAYGPRYFGYSKGEIDQIVEKSLKSVGLYDEVKDQLKKSALELSGGQQQRLSIARALTVDPKVIILDEPCSALDLKNTEIIEKLLLDLKKDYTIIIVTHNLGQAKRISDKTIFLLNGNLIEYQDTEELFQNPKDPRTRDYIDGIYG